jgi:hypothetical protein
MVVVVVKWKTNKGKYSLEIMHLEYDSEAPTRKAKEKTVQGVS